MDCGFEGKHADHQTTTNAQKSFRFGFFTVSFCLWPICSKHALNTKGQWRGLVGKVVGSDGTDPRFETNHRQIVYNERIYC